MIQITKGGKVRGVTVGAYNDIYKPAGWALFDPDAVTQQDDDETPPAGSANDTDTPGVTGNENGSQDENSGAGDDDEDMDEEEQDEADDGIEDLLETPVADLNNKDLAKVARYLEVPMTTDEGNKRKVSAVRKDVAKAIAERK